VVCGKGIYRAKVRKYVRVWWSTHIVNRIEAAKLRLDEGEGGDLGYYPIGPDCLRQHPELKEYTVLSRTYSARLARLAGLCGGANMKLWILEAKEGDPIWQPWYDKTFGFVVRAETEADARRFASEDCGDEGPQAWLSSEHSTCVELTPDGEPGIVIQNHAAA
jgi:hypothetical protein